MNPNRNFLILIAALSVSLSACDAKKPEAAIDSKPALKINGQPVLETEIQTKTAMHGGANGIVKQVSEQAMESMVNMELMRQAAVASKLDSDKSIQAKIAISQRSILAMAYMEQLLASAAKPSDAEIGTYYNQHPERFAERKQYAMQEIQIPAAPDSTSAINDQLSKLKSLEQFGKWLKQSNIPHQSSPISVLTDGMPDDILQKFKNLSVGDHIVLDGKEAMRILFVLSEQKQPATLEQASQQIGNTMFEQRRKEMLESTLKQLRDKAKIEYVAPYTAKGLQVAIKN